MNVRRFLFVLLALTMGALFAAAAFAADPGAKPESAKVKNIRKLLELTKTRELQVQILKQLVGEMKKAVPDAPPTFWDDFVKEASKSDSLIEIMVPIYDKHLDDQDILDMIAFYQSRAGKKLIDVMPQITAESTAAGANWGQKIGEEIVQRLEKQRPQQPPAPPPPPPAPPPPPGSTSF